MKPTFMPMELVMPGDPRYGDYKAGRLGSVFMEHQGILAVFTNEPTKRPVRVQKVTRRP